MNMAKTKPYELCATAAEATPTHRSASWSLRRAALRACI